MSSRLLALSLLLPWASLHAAPKPDAAFSAYPPAAGLRFVRSAEQGDLFLGLTPADRRPGRLAVLLEAGPQSSRDASGHVTDLSYLVAVRDDKGRTFTRTIVPPAP